MTSKTLRNYSCFLAFLLFSSLSFRAFGQVTGTKVVPTDYPTVASAISALNTQGISGNVIINVQAGHTETAPVGGFMLGSAVLNASLNSTNTLTFQKSGAGANPVLTSQVGVSTTVDGLFFLKGTDYVTIDGINLQESATNTTTAQVMEWGYALVKFQNVAPFDGCQNVTIKNCVINLSINIQSNTYGIYAGNHVSSATTALTITAITDANNSNKFFNNTITAYNGIRVQGFAAAAPYTLYDQANEIGENGPNTISSNGNTGTAYGVYAINQNGLKINNNAITGTNSSTQYGVYISTCTNANIDINNNAIDLLNASTTSQASGITLSVGTTAATTSIVNVNNNTISITRNAATTGISYYIYNTTSAPNLLHIKDNVIGGTAGSPNTLSGTGTIYGIYNASNPTSIVIQNNTFSHITRNGTSGTTYGILCTGTLTESQIFENRIHSIIATGGTLGGISSGGTGAVANVYKNNIYNLSNDGTTAAIYGIVAASGPLTHHVYNNYISDLRTPSTSAVSDAIRGISVTSTSANSDIYIHFNTIYLNASSIGTDFSTAGIFHTYSATATSAALNMKNNIVVNNSTPNGTGFTIAFRRSAATSLLNFASSDNNDFFCGTPSANRVIFYDGVTSQSTLNDYKTFVAPYDAASISQLPPFLNIAGTPYNLHLNNTIPTQCESGGVPISLPAAVTTDFDGNPRNPSTPDMGADEFNGIPADLTPPSVAFTPLTFTCAFGDRTFSANIVDGSGIPTTGALVPRVYYRKNLGTWFSQPGSFVSGTANNGTWDFTIVSADMGGLVPTDNVEYYVVAQDIATVPNIGSVPAGVVATNVNTITTPPAVPYNYFISVTMSGTYTLNSALPTNFPATGTNFQTFGDLAFALMNVCLVGPVIVNVDAASGPYNEQFLLGQINGSSAINTVTINGNGRTISFASANTQERGIIKFDGTDYITIDNLNIVPSGASTTEYGYGVHLLNNADNNTISNCTITLANAMTLTSTNYAGIVVNSNPTTATTTGDSQCDNNTFTGNTIIGGYYSVVVVASGATNLMVQNNVFINNNLQDFYLYGFYLNGCENGVFQNNNISRMTRTTASTFYGFYLTGKSTGCAISKNKIHDPFAALTATSTLGAYGIYFTGVDAILGAENLVSNNLIYNFKGNGANLLNGTQYGIYNASSDYVKFYHNTVVLDDIDAAAGSTRGFYHVTAATGIELKNNIIVVGRGGTGLKEVVYLSVAGSVASNYNDLYLFSTAGTNVIGNYGGLPAATLLDWQTASAGDANSISADPYFTDPLTGDYSPSSVAVNDLGTPLGITTDILNAPRSATVPDMGAYEFNVPTLDMGATVLVTPNNTGCYTNAETITITVKNFGQTINFATNPVTITCNVSGAATGTFTGMPTGILAGNGTQDVILTGTVNMSANGTYIFNAFTTLTGDADATNDAMTQVSLVKGITPGTVSSPVTTYCISGTPTLNLTGSFGGAIQWQESTTGTAGTWTNVGAGTTPYIPLSPITQTMYYQAEISCGASSFLTNVQTITVNSPQITASAGATRCGTGTVDLTASGSVGTILNWYNQATGGMAIGNGSPFTTPTISATTNFYVGAATAGVPGSVGPLNPASVGTSAGSALNTWYMEFNVTSDILFTSVDVFPTAAIGSVGSIEIMDNTNVQLYAIPFTTTVTGGSTAQTVPINISLPIGTYRMRQNSAATPISLVRNTAGATYPYTSPGVDITGNNFGTGYFYYFYNWQYIQQCESPRTLVVATVSNPPVITASATPSTICVGDNSALSVSSTNTGYTYTWAPGSLIGAAQTVSPVTSTNYTVTAVDNSGGAFNGCATTADVNVTVNILPATPTISPATVSVCPNQIQQLTAIGSTAPASVVITGGSPTTSTATVSPFYRSFEGAKRQSLVFASELTALGLVAGDQITSLSVNVVTLGTAPINQDNFNLKIGHTVSTDLTAAFASGTVTTVFSSPSYTPVLGANVFTFSAPFVWDGVSNVVVETCWDNDPNNTCAACSGAASSSSVNIATIGAGTTRVVYANNTALSSRDMCAAVPVGTSAVSTTRAIMTVTVLKSNVVWTPVTDLFTDAAATIPYTLGTPALSVYTKPASTITYTTTATAPSTCDATSSRVVTVNPRPTSSVSGGGTVCGGNAVSITLTGTAPWDITYSDGTSSYNVTTSTSPYNTPTNPTGTYTVTALSDANCSALPADMTGSVGVILNTRPTSSITGGGTVCSGQPLPNVSIALTGAGPWNFTYSDGATSFPVANNNTNPYIISAAGAGTYTVTALSDVNCTALPADMTGSTMVVVNPTPPQPTVAVTLNCGGASLAVTSSLVGSVEWRDNTNPTLGTLLSTANPYAVTSTSTYYAFDKSAAGCYSVASSPASPVIVNLPTNIATPGSGYHLANMECVDALGWTHYLKDPTPASLNSGDELLLLSIDKSGYTGLGMGLLGMNLTVAVGAGSGSQIISPTGNNYAQNPWYVMSRYWTVNPLNEPNPTDQIPIRFYFNVADWQAIPGATSASSLAFYKINDVLATYNVDPVAGHTNVPLAGSYAADGAWMYTHGMSATNSWIDGVYGAGHFAEMKVGHFGGGGGGDVDLPLPVEIGSFQGVNNGNTNYLNWNTLSETNNKEFVLMRSHDNISFEAIATIATKAQGGNSQEEIQYSFADETPFEVSYYKIKQIDINGATHFYPQTVELRVNSLATSHLAVFPNPTEKTLNLYITAPIKGDYILALYDIYGKELYTQELTVAGFAQSKVDVSAYAKGTYIVHLRTKTEGLIQTARFVKD